ncbi:FecR family protein [Spirosoma jeollabukense]
MSRHKFGELLQKYLRGECTPEEKTFIEHWYGLLETEPGEIDKELNSPDVEARLWTQIQRQMDTHDPASKGRIIPLKTARYRWIGIAASLLLLGGWFLVRESIPDVVSTPSLTNRSDADWIEQTNTSAKPLAVRLEDGSTVELATRSSLRFPKHFAAEKRTVYLTGDAFFSIQKMPSRPFYVHTDAVVTKVLGTSFFVRTRLDTRQIRVEVVTGRVTVYKEEPGKQPSPREVVLSPNQATTFFSDEDHFVTGLVDVPKLILPSGTDRKSLSLQFDDAPLADVLATLEQAYGIDIALENDQQKNCPLTADLTNQPLYTQLDIICAALKSSYEIQGTTILISGKGCI